MNSVLQFLGEMFLAIGTFNTIFQFIGTLILIATALYIFSGRYIKMLLVILSPLGFRKGYLPKVLLHCRFNSKSNATNNIRLFCEYMILKSQGIYKDKKWWRKEYDNFKSFFDKNSPYDHVFVIENLNEISCDEELENATARYFVHLHENKKRYGLTEAQCNSFLMQINIKYGLLSTNFLLSGLLKTYKEDWNVLIDKYLTIVNTEQVSDDLYASEISYTFVWLLWGPSYQLVEEQDGNFKIAQYSFGDESNSFVVTIPEAENSEERKELWDKLSSTPNGIVCEMTCKLFIANEYMENNREYFSSRSSYYIDKIKSENAFVLEIVSTKEQKGQKAKHYYCTSYVWIVFSFEYNDDSTFDPTKIVAFFEHTNQADKGAYDLCVTALLAKTFAFFDEVLKDNIYERKYQFLVAMNQDIETKFTLMWDEKVSGTDDLSVNYRKYLHADKFPRPENIFPVLDSYFSDSTKGLAIVEVSYKDKESLALWGEYYTSIHIHESKHGSKKDSLDNMIKYLRRNTDESSPPLYHVALTKDGEVVAGIICDYKAKTNCLTLKSIHIKEEYKSKNSEITDEIIRHMKTKLRKLEYNFSIGSLIDTSVL